MKWPWNRANSEDSAEKRLWYPSWGQIDPNRIQATIEMLTTFGTRHTASSQTDPNRGIGLAYAWVFQQMQDIAATSNGNMTVQQQTFVQQPVPGRLANPTSITNTIATLQGTASPQRFYVVTGHLDSRVTDLLNFTDDAPGADDDGSGVACVLELARLFATRQFPGTIVFAAVSGEEEGLFGSSFMAQQMKSADNDVQGMFSNDIIGTGDAHDGTKPDPFTVRMFLEGIPTAVTPGGISLMQAVGGENDGLSRQLGRYVNSVAPFNLTGMNIRLIWRRDRYLRASDHVSFQGRGYAAARFTEPRENFNHEHQNTQVVNGVQLGDLIQYVDFSYIARVTGVNAAARFTEPRENFNHEHQNTQVVNGVQLGDLIDFVDFDYIARVTGVNAAALWGLASSPGTPKNARIHTTPPGTFEDHVKDMAMWGAAGQPCPK